MKKNSLSGKISRRNFLAAAGAAVALPSVFPMTVFGSNRPKPSNRITVAVVGYGFQGPGNTTAFLNLPDCQVVAACDLDRNALRKGVDAINGHYKNKDCKSYHDYREMFARPDIDAVMLAIPDHWHSLVAIEAANRKKDIYGEKPLAKTIAEQQAIVRAVERNGIIWQTGSWQRSTDNFHKAAEIVRNGLIGDVTKVEVGLPEGHTDFAKTGAFKFITPPPPELDYNMWIGPSRMEPYIKARIHKNWRWNYNTGGGQLMDWVGHHVDIAHWGLGFDNSGPSEVEGHGDFPPVDAVWNTATKYWIDLKYPRNVSMVIAGGHENIKKGTKWIGPKGWVRVDRGVFESSNEDWTNMKQLPEDMRKVKLYESSNHQRNFIDCVKSRQPTITPVQTAHHSTIPGHLGLISMWTGRKLRWDVASEKIVGDSEASHLTSRSFRPPWLLPGGALLSPRQMSS